MAKMQEDYFLSALGFEAFGGSVTPMLVRAVAAFLRRSSYSPKTLRNPHCSAEACIKGSKHVGTLLALASNDTIHFRSSACEALSALGTRASAHALRRLATSWAADSVKVNVTDAISLSPIKVLNTCPGRNVLG